VVGKVGLPLRGPVNYQKLYKLLYHPVLTSSKTKETIFQILNRTIWTNNKAFKSARRQDPNCDLGAETLKVTNTCCASVATTLNHYGCAVHWGKGLGCVLIKSTLGPGKPRRDGSWGGKGTREQWGTKGTVYEQPGTEVDNSCHSWRVPSK
jgi:hypothetical protein